MTTLVNIENMSSELLECVMEYYRDEIDNEETKELVVAILRYLYSKTTDKKLRVQIDDIICSMGYCLTCGNKLRDYTYEEYHNETSPPSVEYLTETICPNCDLNY